MINGSSNSGVYNYILDTGRSMVMLTITTLLLLSKITTAQVYNHNYCGTSWSSANSNCGKPCPYGTDTECDPGQTCYADCDNCPAVRAGTAPPTISFIPTRAPVTAAPYAASSCQQYRGTVNFGYYEEWATYRPGNCNPLQPNAIDVAGFRYTHLAFSFAGISSAGLIEPYFGSTEYIPKYASFNSLKSSNPGLKTLIAVGGWSFDQTRFSYASSTASRRANFAQSVVTFLTNYNFDGIDLDWEYPVTRQGTSADYANYPLLCEALRKAFDNAGHPDWLITIATAINWNDRLVPGYDLVGMAAHVDWFNIMAYDIYGSWNSKAGANTDMSYIQNTMNNIFAVGVPREKIVLGLAAYGRSTKLTNPSCFTDGCPVSGAGLSGCHGEGGNLPYFQIMEQYVDTRNYDSLYLNPNTLSMELVTGGYQYFTSFDNAVTLKMKNNYAYDQCLRGIMWWAVDLIKTPINFVMPTTSPTSSQVPSISPAPTRKVTPPPTKSPVSCGSGCPSGSDSMFPILDCGGFYYCVGGVPSQVLMCQPGTLFDSNLKTCAWANTVTCSCTSGGQPPTAPPPATSAPTPIPTSSSTPQPTTTSGGPPPTTPQPTSGVPPPPTPHPTPLPSSIVSTCQTCPSTGWTLISSQGCTGFYHCLDGVLISTYMACPTGTMFDSNTLGCDHASHVSCNCFGPNYPAPAPTAKPTTSPTTPPTTVKPTISPTPVPTAVPTTSPTTPPTTVKPTTTPTPVPTPSPISGTSPPTPNPTLPPTPPPIPATPPPTLNPTNSGGAGGNVWYPGGWINAADNCINDGQEPDWMTPYTSTSKTECCKKFYWWKESDCNNARL